jgi:hypothetical protein
MADVKSTTPLTLSQQIRLESVSLAYRHDRSPEDVIERASKLAIWVEGEQAAGKAKAKPAKGEQVGPDTDLI